MYISKLTAQEIVEEIGREIGEHINLMDEDGVIIASTDFKRIGNVHEGARRIIRENLPELYITQNMENEMTKMGINLPLIVDEQVVGVVGITGERERVYGYGKIVRRMTEILISDSRQKDARRYERRQRYHFLEEWIEYPDISYDLEFRKRAERMNIDLTKEYRVMVLKFVEYESLSDTFDGQRLLEQIEATIRHEAERKSILYLREPTRQVCIIPKCRNDRMYLLAAGFIELIQKKYQKNLIAGYDSYREGKRKIALKKHLDEAEKAVTQAIHSKEHIEEYDQLGMEIFMNNISYDVMQEYIEKLFPQSERLEEYFRLIETYFKCEGSIAKMAEILYVHKNTVQYKLNKLEKLTGKDIRLPSESADYYMALYFYKYMQ